METKEPDSRLSVRKEDLEDQELYNLNKIINDLYSKITTARDETDDAVKKFTRSGVISSVSDQSAASLPPPVEGGIPQPQAADWALNPVVYSAGEDGLQYGFASASISNKPAVVDYYSMFIQDYSSGYVNTSGTAVTLTSASKEAGNTFENCVAGQVININSVAYTIAANPTTPFESLTLTTSAGTQTNVYFNLNPVDGKWEEIASDAEAGTWQLRPPTGWDVPCCLTASTKDQKTYQPPDGVNYKRLQFAAWGDAPQVTNFSVAVEQQDLSTTDIPSGKFVVNFTKPLDPEYNYTSVERLWYVNSSFTGDIGATAIVDVSGNTVTYNSTSSIYSSTFKGQYFNYIQPGDTVYISTGPTLSESNTYIVSEVISNTQLKLTTNPPAGTERVFAQWGRVAGEVNPFTQNDYWPLPTSAEYWKFRARSVNHRELANNTAPPTANVTVPASGGITPLTPATQPGSGDWSLNALQYSTDEAGNSSIFISATISTPSPGADYYSLFWQKTTSPTSGDWIEIAADATAGTWQEWPSAGASYVVAIAANKNTYKLDQPDQSIPSYYKTLVIPAWGDADQVTGFSVTVETDNRAGIPSGRFVFNFTKPADPDYYYAQISRIATDASYVPLSGAVYGVVAGEVNPTKQTDWWPLPETAEYWTFKAESVNYRKAVNTTAAPTSNVSVSTSSGITQIAPATITTAAFASTIRPVDLVTTAGIGVTSIVVSSNTGTVTTASAHGLASGRQVAIYGGTGTSSKLNGLYSITVTGGSTFTITTSGVSNGTYSAGLNEVPLPALPSATYPSGATAFVTANTKLYRSSGTAWTIAADGSDITANSITAGQIAAGAISTTELFAGEILVGQGSGKPTLFKVVDSSSNMIGFIGDITTPTYPVNFVGAYFVNLRIGPNISTPIVSASSSGVSINGATFALTANGITTTIDNTASGGYTAGLRIANATATKLIQVGLSGSSTPSILLNDTTSGSPSAILEVTTGSGGRLSATDLSGTSGVELVGQYSTYTTGTWRGSITTGRIQATREFQLGSSATAGYVLTTDASGIGTWQSVSASSGWTISGSDIYRASGIVTIGTTVPYVRATLAQNFNTNASGNYGGMAINTWSSNGTHGSVIDFNKSGSSSIGTYTAVANGDTLGFFVFRGSDGTGFQRSSEVNGEVDAAVSTGIVPGRLRFRTADSSGLMQERMRIDSSGNVGIGTISPGRILDARGLSAFSDGTQGFILGPYTGGSGYGAIYNFGTTPAVNNYVFASSASETVVNSSTQIVFGIGALEKARIDSTGKVGIGTTSPDALLTVNTIASFGDGAETTPSIAHKGDLNTGLWFPAVDTVAVSTDGAERWRVTSAGFLIPADSDTYDVGILSTNRVRGVYAKIVDTAASGGTGDYIQTRKLQLFDNTGSITAPSFWDMNVVMSGVGALQNSYFYMRDNSGNKVFQSERISSGSAVDRTFWYTDLLPDANLSQSIGDSGTRWNNIYGAAIDLTGNLTAAIINATGSPAYRVSGTTVIDSSRNGSFANLTATGTLTAGGSVGSSGQVLSSTGSGIQWASVVTSITGTSNQVIASASTGSVTLSLPQSIATTSSVTFNSLTLANGASNGILIKDTGGTARVCLTIASDNNLYLDNNDSTYDIYIRPGVGRYTFVDGSYFAPFTNNGISLGYNGQGWSNVYSYNYWTNDGGTWYQGIDGTFDIATSNTLTIRNGIITAIT